jgi:hypothetical protein
MGNFIATSIITIALYTILWAILTFAEGTNDVYLWSKTGRYIYIICVFLLGMIFRYIYDIKTDN